LKGTGRQEARNRKWEKRQIRVRLEGSDVEEEVGERRRGRKKNTSSLEDQFQEVLSNHQGLLSTPSLASPPLSLGDLGGEKRDKDSWPCTWKDRPGQVSRAPEAHKMLTYPFSCGCPNSFPSSRGSENCPGS
jgi:hypothetical protein